VASGKARVIEISGGLMVHGELLHNASGGDVVLARQRAWQILSDARVRIDGGEGREILVSPRPQEETGCSKARDRSAHVESQPWQHPPGDGV
jgi:hypothetical protein